MKNRDLGHQDEMIGLYFEVESKRLLNSQYENKVFGWEQQANLEQAIQDLPFQRGDEKMNKIQKYEEYKQYLKTLNLTSAEYEKRIREWCRKHKY